MEYGASKRVEEQSHTGMTIKTEVEEAAQSTPYVDIEINVNYIKEEPGLVKLVKCEPALSVLAEVVEDDWQGASTSAIVGSTNVFAGTADLGNIPNIKEEFGATDTGHDALQHMGTQYTTNQEDMRVINQESIIKNTYINPILCGGVKKDIIEDEWRDAQHSKEKSQSEPRTQSRPYKCVKCPKTFKCKSVFSAHCKRTHGTGSHECTECNLKYKCEEYLARHMRYVHSKQHYECTVCRKMYRSKEALRRHFAQCHKRRSAGSKARVYICDYCQKTFTIKSSLICHITCVHACGSYKCSQCDKSFKCEQYLIQHTAYMHTEKKLQCKLCGESMKSNEYLRQHLNDLHGHQFAGSSPAIYTCDYCKKTYTRKHGLVIHIEAVHGKVFHRCTECNVDFKYKVAFRRHIKVVHSNEEHECEFCKKIFKTKQYYNRHVRRIHRRKSEQTECRPQFTCSICGKNFKSKWYWQRHEKSGKCTRPTASNTTAVASTSGQQHNVVIVKDESADGELELEPVVFQHMDCNYRPYKPEPQLD